MAFFPVEPVTEAFETTKGWGLGCRASVSKPDIRGLRCRHHRPTCLGWKIPEIGLFSKGSSWQAEVPQSHRVEVGEI